MSADLHGAALAFLVDDVRDAINSDVPDLLAAGAVTPAREAKRRLARRDKPHATAVEIAFVARREVPEGLASNKVELDFDLRCVVRLKDQSEGRAQSDLVEAMSRCLVRRYARRADLAIGAATRFRYARARVRETDDTPESGEIARSIVRLTLTFSEVLA